LALYQPPPPQPFIGGAQPLAPRELTPPSSAPPTAQPPRRALPETVLASWRVEPWPQQQRARLIQEALAANPPFDQSWVFPVINSWQTVAPTFQQRELSPGIPGQSVDNPPNRAAELRAALISWQPPPTVRIVYAKFTQGIDNPPFGLPPRWRFDLSTQDSALSAQRYARYIQQAALAGADNPPFGIARSMGALGQWQPRTLTKIEQALGIPEFAGAIVDNPPFGMAPDWLWSTLGQWQIVLPTPIRYNRLVQEFVAAVVEKTPFNQGWFWAVLNQWPATAPVIQARKLSPGIPGQSVDLPPRRSLDLRSTFVSYLPSAPFVFPPHQLSAGIPGQSVDQPPGRIADIRWWKEPHWAVVNGDLIAALIQPPAVVDNPPFGMPPDWLWVALSQWQPRTLTRIEQGLIGQEGPAIIIITPGYRKIITLRGDRIDVILG